MLTNDYAMALGCKKYRELYPKGLIPPEIEEEGNLGMTPGDVETTIYVNFFFKGRRDPFCLFRAVISRKTGDVKVIVAANWVILLDKEFDDTQFIT